MQHSFCTYFDRNYLIKGLSLISSLIQHHDSSLRIFVVCMDEYTRIILGRLNIPQVTTIPLHEIEQGDSKLLACRSDRSAVEYLWTSTPTIILRILERNPELQTLTYLDADMFCFGSTRAIYDELGSASCLIHEHRYPAYLAHLIDHGRFNVGLLVFRRDTTGFNILRWWRERCIEWCKAERFEGKYGDQKYLDQWPELFPGLTITTNIGVGTAPWNHSQYTFSSQNNRVLINNAPLLVYHFHAFRILNQHVIVPVGYTDYQTPLSFYQFPLLPYLGALKQATQRVRELSPDFTFGLETKDFPLTVGHGFIVDAEALPHLEPTGLPAQRITLDREWVLFPGASTIR